MSDKRPSSANDVKIGEKSSERKRLADYFVIVGLDSFGHELELETGADLHRSPLGRSYKAKVLARYPEQVSHNPFDAAGICMLSLPQGLCFKTQKHKLDPKPHSFATTRDDGKRCHGFSLVFYEEVRNTNICSAMHTLQAMFITELSSGQTPPSLRRIRENEGNGVSKSLPRHFKIVNNSQSAQSYYDITKDKLYVTKAISLVCQTAFATAAEIFLTNLYKCLPRSPGPGLSLESYVYNILYEVCTPSPGKSIRIYLPPEQPHLPPVPWILHQPDIDELPFLDFPIRLLFTYLDVQSVLQLYTCVLLEHQVLLRSSDYQKLMVVAECITSLLYPFQWPHVYAPILPGALFHFLDAPVPFIMGLHSDAESCVKIGSEATLCCVDLDKRIIQLPEELPSFPHRQEFVAEINSVLDRHRVHREHENNSTSVHSPKMSRKDDLMSTSCTLPSGMNFNRKKFSYRNGFDERFDRSETQGLLGRPDSPKRSMMSKFNDVDLSNDCMPVNNSKPAQTLDQSEQYQEDLKINNSIREIFLNRFVQTFASYDHFVIFPTQSKEEWLSNRESMQNFDKASFLSEHPQHHRPFLSRFLESQMFATLIDNKIMTSFDNKLETLNAHVEIIIFDQRIRNLRKRYGDESLIRTINYEPCIFARETQKILEKRLNTLDLEVTKPCEILPHRPAYFRSFPILDKSVLSQECPSRGNSLRRVKNGTNSWKIKDISLESNTGLYDAGLPPNPFALRNTGHLKNNEASPSLKAQANWTFIEKLLKDCKSKTKRMLVEKMDTEAANIGISSEISISGIEENTLIASLCDLLEKIWSHGLQSKQGKSGLWTHLMAYLEVSDCQHRSPVRIDTTYLTPDLATLQMDSPGNTDSLRGRTKNRRNSCTDQLKPLPDSLEFDIKNILAITDIKTEIGYARAWIRLALEKKMLSKHLKVLLSDTVILKSLYKRSGFLRCEEEKEQCLVHLMTLNAVDYYCFTNTYNNSNLPYRIAIFPAKKTVVSSIPTNIWFILSGSFGETRKIYMPKQNLEFVFHHKNLGIITSLRIGQDNPTSKWLLEVVVVRNEVTGTVYSFPSGRWLGRGIDDESIERLLIAEIVPRIVEGENSRENTLERLRTPPRTRSPSITRIEYKPAEIQHALGNCVNAIVKWHYKPTRDRDTSSLTKLLCGEDGLVKCLEMAFLCGFKSSRLFSRNLYIWDYLVKVKEQFESHLNEFDSGTSSESSYDEVQIVNATMWRVYCHLMNEINSVTQTLGKDGKFQLFVCLSLREHILHRVLVPMSATKATQEMYEEESFLRKRNLLTFLRQILEPLDEFHIVLENSITQGIPSQC
uniref:CSON010862 protein n=1 Tax=Culicoides sonorensis TaxID=179676 RepID=A0A336KT57_CULSO